jgi:hypothetical protein
MLINPITNSDTLITNTANFLFYSNLIDEEALNSIMSLSSSPNTQRKMNYSECENASKIVKHVKIGRGKDVSKPCTPKETFIKTETTFWDDNFYRVIDILQQAKVNLFQMTWLDNSVIYESGLFWPKRSLKTSFINKVNSFLSKAKFGFKKANFDDRKTELIPSGYLLSEIINSNYISKVHIFGTKEFYFGNPFNFYNFVNYEILNLKFGDNQ